MHTIHQKHRQDASAQHYWWEQPRLEFMHYLVKNGQLRQKTLLHFVMNYFNFQAIITLKNQIAKNGTIIKLFLPTIRTTNSEMLNREENNARI